MATLVAIDRDQDDIDFTFKCSFVDRLEVGQNISHNGVCPTVVRLASDTYTVTTMRETFIRNNLELLRVGSRVNVERSMLMDGRLDGYIVQGHVDGTTTCVGMEDADGSTYFTFEYPFDKTMAKRGYMAVGKGSVTVNGVLLTVCEPTNSNFRMAIIPYIRENTGLCGVKIGSVINIEFDILDKYTTRLFHFDTWT